MKISHKTLNVTRFNALKTKKLSFSHLEYLFYLYIDVSIDKHISLRYNHNVKALSNVGRHIMTKKHFINFNKFLIMMVLVASIFLLVACTDDTNKMDVTVSFITNDTVEKSSIDKPAGAVLTQAELTIHERDHFDFNGWFLDPEFETKFEITMVLDGSITLYAQWKEHEKTSYTVKHILHSDVDTFELHSEVVVEDVYVGSVVSVETLNIEGYTHDAFSVDAIIDDNHQTVIEIIYEKPTFRYELMFNGGNYWYENREQMVSDWLSDYNMFADTSYTIASLPMDKDSLLDIAEFMYDETFRDKWLWLPRYLRLEGSDTNKSSLNALIAQNTLEKFYEHNEKNQFAVSYEIRAFMKGTQFIDDPALISSDYAQNSLKEGFWPFVIGSQQIIFEDARFEVTLPTELYKEGFVFYGWYETENFYGKPVTTVDRSTTLFARFDGENPIDSIVIENEVEYMEKGTELALDITILPENASFTGLLFEIRAFNIASVSETGVITAINEGEFTLTIMAENGRLLKVIDMVVYPKDDIVLNFNDSYNGYLQVGEQFEIEVIGVGREATSKHYTLSVQDDTVVSMSEPGVFNALSVGTTQIDIYNLDTLVMSYTVVVQDQFTTSRIDQLLTILAQGHNPIATPMNLVTRYETTNEWRDPKHESVNAYLFDDLVIDASSYPMPPGEKTSGIRPSTEFILVHDTANLHIGLMGHGAFFQNPANAVSIHYITGDFGVLQSLAENAIGWHAGDGTGTPFEWYKTGVMATNDDKPYIDISADGYFTFNGEKTDVIAPKGLNGEILTRDYFTYLGPTWDIFDGEYVIGRTYLATNQQKRGVIASYGGNRNSVGIEMSINVDGDIIDTVQRTAKLVAHLLEQYDLPNHRVITHNTTDGKGDPYTLHNTVYNGTWYFDRFMEYVEIEREILVNYSDAIITISSESDLVSSTGRIIRFPDVTTEVMYTITVEIDGVSKSIDLVTVVPGMSTWDQHHGFFTPTQSWAKSDYRNE